MRFKKIKNPIPPFRVDHEKCPHKKHHTMTGAVECARYIIRHNEGVESVKIHRRTIPLYLTGKSRERAYDTETFIVTKKGVVPDES